jgi:hypothetical protein
MTIPLQLLANGHDYNDNTTYEVASCLFPKASKLPEAQRLEAGSGQFVPNSLADAPWTISWTVRASTAAGVVDAVRALLADFSPWREVSTQLPGEAIAHVMFITGVDAPDYSLVPAMGTGATPIAHLTLSGMRYGHWLGASAAYATSGGVAIHNTAVTFPGIIAVDAGKGTAPGLVRATLTCDGASRGLVVAPKVNPPTSYQPWQKYTGTSEAHAYGGACSKITGLTANTWQGTPQSPTAVDSVGYADQVLALARIANDGTNLLAPTANTVGMWELAEGTGSTDADLSGGGRTLTLTGATWGSDPPFNSYAHFAGAGHGSTASLPSTATSNITIGVVFYLDSAPAVGTNQGLVQLGTIGTNGYEFYVTTTAAGTFLVMSQWPGASVQITDLPVSIGAWHYAVFTRDTTAGYFVLDGVVSSISSSVVPTTPTAYFNVGGFYYASAWTFPLTGRLALVHIDNAFTWGTQVAANWATISGQNSFDYRGVAASAATGFSGSPTTLNGPAVPAAIQSGSAHTFELAQLGILPLPSGVLSQSGAGTSTLGVQVMAPVSGNNAYVDLVLWPSATYAEVVRGTFTAGQGVTIENITPIASQRRAYLSVHTAGDPVAGPPLSRTPYGWGLWMPNVASSWLLAADASDATPATTGRLTVTYRPLYADRVGSS